MGGGLMSHSIEKRQWYPLLHATLSNSLSVDEASRSSASLFLPLGFPFPRSNGNASQLHSSAPRRSKLALARLAERLCHGRSKLTPAAWCDCHGPRLTTRHAHMAGSGDSAAAMVHASRFSVNPVKRKIPDGHAHHRRVFVPTPAMMSYLRPLAPTSSA